MKTGILVASFLMLLVAVNDGHVASAVSLESAGVMARNTRGPDTGFALSATDGKAGAFSVTTAPTNAVIFNAVGDASCIEKLSESAGGGIRTIQYIVGGNASLAEAVIPSAGTFDLDDNDYVGLVQVKVNSSGNVIETQRGNFPSEFEACLGDSPAPGTGGLQASFPRGDLAFCGAVNFEGVNYVTCKDVVRDYPLWRSHLDLDRTLISGKTELIE